MLTGRSTKVGSGRPVRLNRVPDRMPTISGLVSTLRAVLAKPLSVGEPLRAHSIDTVTSVHRIRPLNTSTSATDGIAASPASRRRSASRASRYWRKYRPAQTPIRRRHPAGRDAGRRGAKHEHDQATAEERDQQPGVDRRALREVAHHAKQHGGQGEGKHETRQAIGDAGRPFPQRINP